MSLDNDDLKKAKRNQTSLLNIISWRAGKALCLVLGQITYLGDFFTVHLVRFNFNKPLLEKGLAFSFFLEYPTAYH